jgi:hypothetical protein
VVPKSSEKKNREHAPVAAEAVHHGRQHRRPVDEDAPTPPSTSAALLILPNTVISKSEVSKCLRELEGLNDYFHQAGLRGSKDQTLPTPSKSLESIATINKLNLITPEARQEVGAFLAALKAKAPVVHMSFPSDASDQFLTKLLEWFRTNVHPHILLQVGLQPELAAGCTLRTPNKFFDFSFRRRFEASKEKLITAIEALDDGVVVATTGVVSETAAVVDALVTPTTDVVVDTAAPSTTEVVGL